MAITQWRRIATAGSALILCATIATATTAIGDASAASKAPKVPGVTATQVTIGATVPLTGIASSGYNEVAKAANAVFKYVNSKGGINGRKIKYVLEDDCYGTPGFGCTGVPNTVTQTHKLLSIPVFATVGSLGTPTQDLVRTLLSKNGVPQLFVNSGSSDWNDPSQYKGLFGWQPSYTVESKILAKYINATYANQSVCFLGQGDDFGTNGLAGLVAGGVSPTVTDFYSTTSLVATNGASIAPYIQAFQNAKCTVVYLDTIPGATDAALGAALQLSYAPHWVISSVGSDPQTVDAPFASLGIDPEVGAISFTYLPTPTSGSAWIKWMYKVIEADPADFPGFTSTSVLNGNIEYGVGWGVAFAEALKASGRNFTRASFLKVLTSTTLSQTPALAPLQYTSVDHQGLNAGQIDQVTSATSVKTVSNTVYTTNSKNGPVTTDTHLSTGIPSWLK
jgi:branched-chain amino acid transport system substrate-binding protein